MIVGTVPLPYPAADSVPGQRGIASFSRSGPLVRVLYVLPPSLGRGVWGDGRVDSYQGPALRSCENRNKTNGFVYRCSGSNIPGQDWGPRFSLYWAPVTAMSSRSLSVLTSARDKAVHSRQPRGPYLKKFHRRDVIANGLGVGLGYRNKQIQPTCVVKKRPASMGHKKIMSIQGQKVSTSCTPNRYYTNTKAIKDV